MPDFEVGDLVEFLVYGHRLSGIVIETGVPNHSGVLFTIVWSPAYVMLPERRHDSRRFVHLHEDDNYYNHPTLPRIISRCASFESTPGAVHNNLNKNPNSKHNQQRK